MRPFLLLLLTLSAGCAPKNIMIWTGEAGTGAPFDCVPSSKSYTCAPSTRVVPGEETQSGTLYINLPQECEGRVRQLLLQNVPSGKPLLKVKCAPTPAPVVVIP